jgi:hypothetical protein
VRLANEAHGVASELLHSMERRRRSHPGRECHPCQCRTSALRSARGRGRSGRCTW